MNVRRDRRFGEVREELLRKAVLGRTRSTQTGSRVSQWRINAQGSQLSVLSKFHFRLDKHNKIDFCLFAL